MRNNWTTEASDIELRPGAWPARLEWTPPGGYTRREFYREAILTDNDGDVTHARYRDSSGNILVVFND